MNELISFQNTCFRDGKLTSTGRMSRVSSSIENKAQYCSLRIILDETVILKENKEYFVRGAVDCDDFNVETRIFVGYKDKLATIDVLAANTVVSVGSNGKITVRLYNLSNNELKMYKGTKLGSAEIFQEEGGYFRTIKTSIITITHM